MSNYFYAGHPSQQQPQQPTQHQTHNPHPLAVNNSHHSGRSRRAMRISSSQHHGRQFRHQHKPMRDVVTAEPPSVTAFRVRFEAGRSFDLDDDLEFCPGNLLSFDEVGRSCSLSVTSLATTPCTDFDQRQSVASSSSDRSSLGSTSPDSSPLQTQITPASSLSGAANKFMPPPSTWPANNQNPRLHQPAALRGKNAIPIVNPSTGSRIASPPSSVSPGMMQRATAARRW